MSDKQYIGPGEDTKLLFVRTGKSNANINYPSQGTLPSQLGGPNALIMVKMSTTVRIVLFYSAPFIGCNLLRLANSFEAVHCLNKS